MSEPIIEYREEFNVSDIARKYAKRVARVIDEQTLANVEDQLAKFGYVKVVRCRDCVNMHEQPWNAITATGLWCIGNDIPVNADGFCAWAKRKEVNNADE